MRIVVTGGTGFLGRPLVQALAADGHEVIVLSRAASGHGTIRNAPSGSIESWTPNGEAGAWAAPVDGAGAVINLAGESIAAKRWTPAHKQRVLDSRLIATRSIVAAIRRAVVRPPLLVSGSAVGYYGSRGDEVLTEDARAGDDFLADVCARWEAEAQAAANDRTRVVCVRTGLVLEKSGGALPEMLPPFRFGAGGPVGSGKQYWPWIHRTDWIGLVRWIVNTPNISGPVNATAPNPVTNAEFARALGRAMHRPAFMPAPAFALRLLLGEMADSLLLSGQRAIPRRAEQGGFTFAYRNVDDALRAIFNGR